MSQLSERACEAPGHQPILGLLWYLIYLNTHTHTHTHTHTSSRRVCDSGPSQFCNHAQSGGPSKTKTKTKTQNRSSGLSTAAVLWSFSCLLCLSSDSRAAPVPGGPEIQAFGSRSWQMRYLFVCLLLREGRWEEEAQGRGVQSLALVECETPGHHP